MVRKRREGGRGARGLLRRKRRGRSGEPEKDWRSTV